MKRTIFFIRHGESMWNEATEKGKISQIVGHDHPLNLEGIEQAYDLRNKWRFASFEYAKRIKESDDQKVKSTLIKLNSNLKTLDHVERNDSGEKGSNSSRVTIPCLLPNAKGSLANSFCMFCSVAISFAY